MRVRAHEELADVIPGTLNRVPGVTHTETHIAFRTYSRHDLEAAFALGYPEAASNSAPSGQRTAAQAVSAARRWLAATHRPSRAAAAPESSVAAARAQASDERRRRDRSARGTPAAAASAAAAFSTTVSRTGPGSPASTARATAALRGRVPAAQVRRAADRGSPSVRRVEHGLADRAVVHHPDRGRVRRGQLVQPVVAVEDQRRAAPCRPARRP